MQAVRAPQLFVPCPLQWFEDAEPAVVELCRAAVQALERQGLEVG